MRTLSPVFGTITAMLLVSFTACGGGDASSADASFGPFDSALPTRDGIIPFPDLGDGGVTSDGANPGSADAAAVAGWVCNHLGNMSCECEGAEPSPLFPFTDCSNLANVEVFCAAAVDNVLQKAVPICICSVSPNIIAARKDFWIATQDFSDIRDVASCPPND